MRRPGIRPGLQMRTWGAWHHCSKGCGGGTCGPRVEAPTVAGGRAAARLTWQLLSTGTWHRALLSPAPSSMTFVPENEPQQEYHGNR